MWSAATSPLPDVEPCERLRKALPSHRSRSAPKTTGATTGPALNHDSAGVRGGSRRSGRAPAGRLERGQPQGYHCSSLELERPARPEDSGTVP